MRGVENVMVRIFRTRTVVVWGGERASVEWHRIDRSTFLPSTFKTSLVFNSFEGNVGGGFRLSVLIDEDKGVLTGISGIELLPSLTWMLGVL